MSTQRSVEGSCDAVSDMTRMAAFREVDILGVFLLLLDPIL